VFALAEWYFRSGLDRYIWIWGMVCAYIHPYCMKLLNAIEELPAFRQLTVRALVLSLTALLGWVYYVHIYSLPKLEYNKVRCCQLPCSSLSAEVWAGACYCTKQRLAVSSQ
jgi:hypothetical protein